MIENRKNKVNVPISRFPGFNGEWEVKKLNELLDFKNGINASKEDYGFGYKFINVLDIIQNDYITYNRIRGEVNVSEEVFANNLVQYGDILFQRSSETRDEVGQSNVYLDKKKNATFGGFVIRGRKINEYHPVFLHLLLKTSIARKEITSKSGGSTRYNVGQGILSSVQLSLPKLEEQNHIANFISQVIERIQTQNEIIDNLELLKKGLLQKLFSQEIRFRNEEGEVFPKWERKSLEQICDIVKGKQLNKEDLTISGTYPCQNGGISPSGFTESFNTVENTITISEGGNSCGYINFQKTKFWSGGHCYSLLKLKNEVIVSFLFQYLKFNENKIMRLRVGSGLPNIQKKSISLFKIQLPSIEEQNKISNFLSSIDKKIEVEMHLLDHLENQKKYLLQNLFI